MTINIFVVSIAAYSCLAHKTMFTPSV